ncbi:MAG: hypothetical protein KKE11_00655, partial [Gammaproteobacteria bacterium]|nr:hypothetical protein [Gammaproteobacteria bacterium]
MSPKETLGWIKKITKGLSSDEIKKLKKEVSTASTKSLNRIRELETKVKKMIDKKGGDSKDVAPLKKMLQILKKKEQEIIVREKKIIFYLEQEKRQQEDLERAREFEAQMMAFIEKYELITQERAQEAAIEAQEELYELLWRNQQLMLRYQYLQQQIQEKTEENIKLREEIEGYEEHIGVLDQEIVVLKEEGVKGFLESDLMQDFLSGDFGEILSEIVPDILQETFDDESIEDHQGYIDKAKGLLESRLEGRVPSENIKGLVSRYGEVLSHNKPELEKADEVCSKRQAKKEVVKENEELEVINEVLSEKREDIVVECKKISSTVGEIIGKVDVLDDRVDKSIDAA